MGPLKLGVLSVINFCSLSRLTLKCKKFRDLVIFLVIDLHFAARTIDGATAGYDQEIGWRYSGEETPKGTASIRLVGEIIRREQSTSTSIFMTKKECPNVLIICL